MSGDRLTDDDLAAIKAAEIKAGLDWTLENAHPLLMSIGPVVAELVEARAALTRVRVWLERVDPRPETNGDQFRELRAALDGDPR